MSVYRPDSRITPGSSSASSAQLDLACSPGSTTPAAATAALDRAGAADVAEQAPAGLATQLGPSWPGGVDLSGGQWQKLAIGRAMMRTDPLLLLLDEPTAAIDAETEHELFARWTEAASATRRRSRAPSPCSYRTGSRPCGWPT